MMVPNILRTSSCPHVVLLVFMRLLAVSRPLTYTATRNKIRRRSIVIIWLISISAQLLVVMAQIFAAENIYVYYRNIYLHVFHSIPVISIVVMHVTLIRILERKNNSDAVTGLGGHAQSLDQSINMKMTIMVKRIVSFLLLCYVPFLIWWQYFNIASVQKRPWIPTPLEVVLLFKLW